MKSGIYLWRNLVTNRVLVGQTINFNRRRLSYLSYLRNNNYKSNQYLQRSWNKHGEKNFRFEVLEEIKDITTLTIREQYWLDYYRHYSYGVYNQVGPADNPNIGRKLSKATRKRMSLSKMGKPNLKLRGRKISEAHKLAVSRATKGRLVSKETRTKLSIASKRTAKRKRWEAYRIREAHFFACAEQNALLKQGFITACEISSTDK